MNANHEVTLEICSNTEWLREMAGLSLDRIADGLENDAAEEFGREIDRRLSALGYGCISPRGQRVLYHGWNGANTFAHKLGAVGTFSPLSAEQQEEIFAAQTAAEEDIYARFAPEPESEEVE